MTDRNDQPSTCCAPADASSVGPWHVYLLECTARSGRVTLHVGIAKDVYARVVQHTNGQVKQTRGRAVRLLAYSLGMAQGAALRCEKQLKKSGVAAKRAVADDWSRVLRAMDADPKVLLARMALDDAERALQRARACFGADHPTADDELAGGLQGVADAQRWLSRA